MQREQQRLPQLEGRKVLSANRHDDVFVIALSDGWKFAAFNSVVIEPDPHISGKVVIEAVVEKEVLKLTFDDGHRLAVDLRDAAYDGPEAAEITGPNKEILVIR